MGALQVCKGLAGAGSVRQLMAQVTKNNPRKAQKSPVQVGRDLASLPSNELPAGLCLPQSAGQCKQSLPALWPWIPAMLHEHLNNYKNLNFSRLPAMTLA